MTKIDQMNTELAKWKGIADDLPLSHKNSVLESIAGVQRKSEILCNKLASFNPSGDNSTLNRLKMSWDDLNIAYENLQIKINEFLGKTEIAKMRKG